MPSKELRRMGRAELEAEITQLRAAQSARPYVVEPLAPGRFCPNPACGVFNGDCKVFLTACRACGTERPRA